MQLVGSILNRHPDPRPADVHLELVHESKLFKEQITNEYESGIWNGTRVNQSRAGQLGNWATGPLGNWATHRFEQTHELGPLEVEAVRECGQLRRAPRLELEAEVLGEQRVHVARVGRRRGEHFGHEVQRQVLRAISPLELWLQ